LLQDHKNVNDLSIKILTKLFETSIRDTPAAAGGKSRFPSTGRQQPAADEYAGHTKGGFTQIKENYI
jgi:hypothetical protein